MSLRLMIHNKKYNFPPQFCCVFTTVRDSTVCVVILRYTVTPLGGQTSLYLEDLGDKQHTRGGSRVRTINNPFELTES